MMADEHFFHFSNTPLVVISLTAQCLATGVLLWLEWRLLRSRPRWVTVFAMAATAHLALTSLQLETFLFGMQVLFTVGLLGAFGSIILFALATRNGRISPHRAIAAFGCALVCAFSMGTGVFVGPAILLVAWGLRARPRVLVMLVLISGIFGAVYSVGYSNPGHGMGLLGLPRDPLGALRITALVLGGPITDQSLWWGAACGFAGMLVLVPATLRLLRGGGDFMGRNGAYRHLRILRAVCVGLRLCPLHSRKHCGARFY